MAKRRKVRLRSFYRVAPPGSPTLFSPRGFRSRPVKVYLDVGRSPGAAKTDVGGFLACVKIGSSRNRGAFSPGDCAAGRNPRFAIAAALRKAAARMTTKRRGAFAAYRRK
jgi:hypothetical protein